MNRREWMQQSFRVGAALPLLTWGSAHSQTPAAPPGNLLILIELKGANDGLNTIVPFSDAAYATLRPRISIKREEVVQLSERAGFHPALAPLLPLWQGRQMAVVEGVGYPSANLSHFRSIEIWETASNAN